MNSLRMKSFGWGVALVISGCGAGAPEPRPASGLSAGAPQPESGEWLYATQRGASGRNGECRAVYDWVLGERGCKQALCGHGARLGADWLRVCKDILPDQAAEVEQVTTELRVRGGGAPTPCEREASELLSGACGQGEQCIERAQSWSTRCGEEATPLVVRMLEVRLERSAGAGAPVRLDARSCDAMFSDVRKAASCSQRFQCEDALPAMDLFRARCRIGGLATLEQAVIELGVLAGAERPTEPIAIAPTSKLRPDQAPLAFADGSGAVLSVCGARVPDLATYLERRKSCDGDSVTVVRRVPTEHGTEARLGRIPHPGDVLFRLRFPSLVVQGELRARDEADLARFKRSLDELLRAPLDGDGNVDRAVGGLVKAVNMYLDGVQNSALFEAELRQRDDSLVPLFRALGNAKKSKILESLAPGRFFASLHRAERSPLADVRLDGKVVPGESTPAAIVDFSTMLPKATAAYRKTLEPRLESARKLRAPAKLYAETLQKLATHAASCADAEGSYGACEVDLLSCAFGVQSCDAARLEEKAAACDESRIRAEREHLQARLALDSLSEENRKAGIQAFAGPGCRAPWW